MTKFERENQEAVAMCNARRLREQMAAERARIIDADYVVVDDIAEARIQVLKVAAGVAARAMIGCFFLGAISRGWVAAPFGLLASACCFVWAYEFAKR